MKLSLIQIISLATTFVFIGLVSFISIKVHSGEPHPVDKNANAYHQSDVPSDCARETETVTRTVRGESLAPRITHDATLQIDLLPPECIFPEREALVLASYPGHDTPLVKIVRGLPGDTFALVPTGSEEYYVSVNDQILQTDAKVPYRFTEQSSTELRRYGERYGYTIPRDRYLLLGNVPGGSLDATVFGFTSRNAFLGMLAANP